MINQYTNYKKKRKKNIEKVKIFKQNNYKIDKVKRIKLVK